jgi:c(7)-type cytochrome triheme protein
MPRILSILVMVLMLTSCKGGVQTGEKSGPPEKPRAITSLKDSGLPCFSCHSYEKFSANEPGKFSHVKHIAFGVHCNQCHIMMAHEKMVLNKDICSNCHDLKSFVFPDSGMPVTFSHQKHAGNFSCSQCHPAPFRMKRGVTPITMKGMFSGETCGKCHNGKIAFPAKDCARCHNMSALKKEFSYPSAGMSPAVFSHGVHTAMFECGSCHTGLFKYKKGGSGIRMDGIYKGKFCGKCHDGQTAFASTDCQKCHK